VSLPLRSGARRWRADVEPALPPRRGLFASERCARQAPCTALREATAAKARARAAMGGPRRRPTAGPVLPAARVASRPRTTDSSMPSTTSRPWRRAATPAFRCRTDRLLSRVATGRTKGSHPATALRLPMESGTPETS